MYFIILFFVFISISNRYLRYPPPFWYFFVVDFLGWNFEVLDSSFRLRALNNDGTMAPKWPRKSPFLNGQIKGNMQNDWGDLCRTIELMILRWQKIGRFSLDDVFDVHRKVRGQRWIGTTSVWFDFKRASIPGSGPGLGGKKVPCGRICPNTFKQKLHHNEKP